jgi:hypothetical protein
MQNFIKKLNLIGVIENNERSFFINLSTVLILIRPTFELGTDGSWSSWKYSDGATTISIPTLSIMAFYIMAYLRISIPTLSTMAFCIMTYLRHFA